MASKTLETLPTAFVFDVFGTVFDWRTTVAGEISRLLSQKITSLDAIGAHPSSIPPSTSTSSQPDLSTADAIQKFSKSFAQEWRDSYKDFVVTSGGTKSPLKSPDIKNNDVAVALNDIEPSIPRTGVKPSEKPYTTVDNHHLQSLRRLLKKYSLFHIFSISEIHTLSRVWHTLKPWDDSSPGIEELKKLAIVSTLSNGNIRLLVDLQKNSGVGFDVLLSAQLWKSYKPEPEVYVGACEVLGVGGKEEWEEYLEERGDEGVKEDEWRFGERGKVAMVAAHIGDLRAAKACGLTTIYIERPKEDDDESAGEKYLKEGEDWIDMWVRHDEGGILEAARRLGELKGK
ncbi:hypothetical protein TWF730_005173 [Orbilia blumenaviensis]|uniref:Haloacid dehalogenase n=1 Tax=Orbilia blumenaviensis TaxID=1796055 RepID=A0AAV9VNP4_9PEZI